MLSRNLRFMKTEVELLDSSLREGEQTANVSFTVDQKLEIAGLAVSPDVKEAVERLAHQETRAKKLVHARALKKNIDDAKKAGVSWVGFFFGMSPLSLEYKFQIGQDEALKRIRNSVRYAKDQGLNVRFTAEDATTRGTTGIRGSGTDHNSPYFERLQKRK